MPDTRTKTISYRRAFWLNDNTTTLEQCLLTANQRISALKDQWVIVGEQTVRIAKVKKDTRYGGLLIHLTAETEGEAASIVPKATPTSTEIDLKTQAPPDNAEWLDGDAFLYVQGNHVCICTTAVSDGAVKVFFFEYFKKARLLPGAGKFDLMKVADISKIKMIRKQGVKEIVLKASMYKASANYQRRTAHAMNATGVVSKHIKALLGKPNDVSPDALQVCVTFKTDKRKTGLVVGEKEIVDIAADVVKNAEEDDDFAILTKENERITPKEIFVRSRVEIERDGKTVKCDAVWSELTKFFENMQSQGILEQ